MTLRAKIYGALTVSVIVLTVGWIFLAPAIQSAAAGNTPLTNGWGNSNGKAVFQSKDGEKQISIDAIDFQKLYELAR